MRNSLEVNRRNKLNLLIPYNEENLKNEFISYISYPLLLRYFRAHSKCITDIQYIDDRELIITSSVDYNVRLFTLTGSYVGIFGQETQWNITQKQFEYKFEFFNKVKIIKFFLIEVLSQLYQET